MTAIKSANRNMKTEDEAFEREMAGEEDEITGTQIAGDDPMEIMVAGDMNFPPPPPPSEPSKPTINLGKLALAAALAAGTGGIGIGAFAPLVWNAVKSPPPAPPPAEAPVDTDTRNTFTLS